MPGDAKSTRGTRSSDYKKPRSRKAVGCQSKMKDDPVPRYMVRKKARGREGCVGVSLCVRPHDACRPENDSGI